MEKTSSIKTDYDTNHVEVNKALGTFSATTPYESFSWEKWYREIIARNMILDFHIRSM